MSRFIAWSGGYDSTLVLQNEVDGIKDNGTINTITVNCSLIHEEKLACEESHRRDYIEYVKQKYGDKITITQHVVDIKSTPSLFPGGYGQRQALLFMLMCAYFAPSKDDTFVFGFHRGDDFWDQRFATSYILDYFNIITKQHTKFEFPLQYNYKHEIVRSIRALGLEKFVWTCEDPVNYQPCGKCIPCLAIQTADYRILLEEKLGLVPKPDAEEKLLPERTVDISTDKEANKCPT